MNRYRFEAADATGKIEVGHLEADLSLIHI